MGKSKEKCPKKQDPDAKDRIWVELEWPVGCGDRIDEVAERRAEAANTMLRKLGDHVSRFWWHDLKKRYCFSYDTAGSYYELYDNGHWLNLSYIGQ